MMNLTFSLKISLFFKSISNSELVGSYSLLSKKEFSLSNDLSACLYDCGELKRPSINLVIIAYALSGSFLFDNAFFIFAFILSSSFRLKCSLKFLISSLKYSIFSFIKSEAISLTASSEIAYE